jgi:hypothetical protein
MSLRASVSAIDLGTVQSAFGSRDDDLRRRWKEALPGAFREPRDARNAEKIVDWLIDLPADALRPRVELEFMAITVNAWATSNASQAAGGAQIFFEALFGHIAQPKSRIEWLNSYRPWFRNGRPLVGPAFDSGWSYYAWLTRHELPEFVAQIEDDVRITSFFSSAEGLDFLKAAAAAERDLWVFYS